MRQAHNFRDLTGMVFEKLTVMKRIDNAKSGKTRWLCKCNCGKEKVISLSALMDGQISCGCARTFSGDPNSRMPGRVIQITGQKFNLLTVIGPSPERKYGGIAWRCRCDCGSEINVTKVALTRGYSKSCGCHGMDDLIGRSFGKLTVISKKCMGSYIDWECICACGKIKTLRRAVLESGMHKSCGCGRRNASGLSLTPEYQAWNSMRCRCRLVNKNNKRYVGRGISVCDRWMKFENFYEDMGLRPSKLHSVDRIDNDKGYFKENCRWATKKEQARNRHTNALYECDGKTQCLAAWAEEYGIGFSTILQRLKRGKSFSDAIKTPVNKSNGMRQ